jgi:hypothetical protein
MLNDDVEVTPVPPAGEQELSGNTSSSAGDVGLLDRQVKVRVLLAAALVLVGVYAAEVVKLQITTRVTEFAVELAADEIAAGS